MASVTAANAIAELLANFYNLEPAGLLVQERNLTRMEENVLRKACSGAASEMGSQEGSHSRDSQIEVVDEERIRKLLSKLDLSGIESWSEGDQEDVRGLIQEFHHLFALDDLQLDKTDLVKHTIRLQDYTPFKE